MSRRPLRIAVLVKQVPRFESMELGADGRLRRDGLELEMNPYCRRAVSKGVALARESGGSCTVITLGPPAAEDTLREAVAWGADEGVLVTDPAFAGSDTLATARALAAALRAVGPFDLVLLGRNSVDADTGQVPPELAELLDLPFAAGVRELAVVDGGDALWVRCEQDDAWLTASVRLPAVLSVAERLCEPAKVDPDGRAAVPAARMRRMSAADLGDGPWGQPASPTVVGEVERLEVRRLRLRLQGPVDEQVRRLLDVLDERRVLDPATQPGADARVAVPPGPVAGRRGEAVLVVVEPGRDRAARELLGRAAQLAAQLGGHVVAVVAGAVDERLPSWGADAVVPLVGDGVEEDVAAAVSAWCAARSPWAVLLAGTVWGREVGARVAARLGAGLVGDAVDLDLRDGRLVSWKPAFGGNLVAAITATSATQMATVRPGVLPLLTPRSGACAHVATPLVLAPRRRVVAVERTREDDVEILSTADVVIGVGAAVPPERYDEIRLLCAAAGAEMAASRKVTDRGWLPRSRQVGITGHSITPRLYIAVGLSGKFNHVVGVRGAGLVVAINNDPQAPVFDAVDVGLVADWGEVVARLSEALAHRRAMVQATPA